MLLGPLEAALISAMDVKFAFQTKLVSDIRNPQYLQGTHGTEEEPQGNVVICHGMCQGLVMVTIHWEFWWCQESQFSHEEELHFS